MPDAVYSRRQLSRILHLQAGQIRRWQRAALFPRRSRYAWSDLVRARALLQMEAGAIGWHRLRRSLNAAAARLPELNDPLLEAGWRVNRGRVEVLHHGLYMDALTGQMRLPFPGPPPTAAPAVPAAGERQAEYWFSCGLALEQDKALQGQAIAAYRHCLELDPNFASAHINLGTLYYHGRQFADAERSYRAAVAIDPDYALAHFNLGNVLDETGRLDEAIAAYSEAVRLAPNYADAHYNLALAFQRLGQRRRAVPHWQQYLDVDRTSSWAAHARTQLKLAIAHDELKLVRKDLAPAAGPQGPPARQA